MFSTEKTCLLLSATNAPFRRLKNVMQKEHTTMKEEFREYGLSENTMYAVRAIKVSLAGAMLAGHAKPQLMRPASRGPALFMLGAVGMHIRVGDPMKR